MSGEGLLLMPPVRGFVVDEASSHRGSDDR